MNLEFGRGLSDRARNWRSLPNSTGANLSRICYSLAEVVALLRHSERSEEPHSWFTCFRTIARSLGPSRTGVFCAARDDKNGKRVIAKSFVRSTSAAPAQPA